MATIDPNIALQLRPVELPNPLTQFAQVQQIRGAQQQNALADLVMGEKLREIAATEAVNNVYRTAGDPSAPDYRARLLSGLATAGQGARIPGLQKTFLEADDKLADTKKKAAETGEIETKITGMKFKQWDEKRQIAIADIAAFDTPEQALASLNMHAQKGDIPPEQAELIRKTIPSDPAQFPAWQIGMLKRIMNPQQAAGYVAPDANTVLTNDTSRANNQATVAQAERASLRTDARQKETNALPRGQVVQTDAGPMLVDPRTGTAVPVTAGGKPVGAPAKPLTEFQGKSAGFGDRASKADKILTEIADKYSPAAINSKTTVQDWPVIGGIAGAAVNLSLSDSDQRAEQAQRDFVNAVLRQESGAVIGQSEFENAKRQYFPQPGDGKKVIAQKAANRKTAIEALMRSAGPTAGVAAPAGGAAAADGGLKFLGFE